MFRLRFKGTATVAERRADTEAAIGGLPRSGHSECAPRNAGFGRARARRSDFGKHGLPFVICSNQLATIERRLNEDHMSALG
jgi:hypothetical protein